MKFLGAAVAAITVIGVTTSSITLSNTRADASAQTAAKHVFGVTHTQDDAAPGNPATAIASAEQVLRSSAIFQDQPIMGWGTGNPEPSPGVYDWASLDERVQLIKSTGGTPVLTLCGAPDWMKGGTAGTTNWSQLNAAPNPAHYEAFAQLAVAVAKRYPSVHYFMVWSELRGFFDNKANNWNIARYTQLYNDVYSALKAYNPSLQVGGPYATINSWRSPSAGGYPSRVTGSFGTLDERDLSAVSYWLDHKKGADFLAVDGTTAPEDDPDPSNPAIDLSKVTAVMTWLHENTTLPIWWSEAYAGLQKGVRDTSDEASRVYTALGMRLAASNASRVLFWDAQQYAQSATPGIYTSTTGITGGRATPFDADLNKLNAIASGSDVELKVVGYTYTLSSTTGSLTITV